MNGTGINLPGLALVVIAVVVIIALFHGWGG
jgi:hypothetical protein